MTPRDDATTAQVNAADPRKSTWLGANAGSGKTRVLTDRVARLLLNDVQPQHILCLTYTKAAASEMQNRLFKRLGTWAMLEDDQLHAALRELGYDGTLEAEVLRKARTLFARAIETPGGLKIQTIHSFCSGLLRRFPLEAGVSPQFTEMEDRAAQLLREEIVEGMAGGEDAPLVNGLARYLTDQDFAGLTGEIVKHRDALEDGKGGADILASFDLPADATKAGSLSVAFDGIEADFVKRLATVSVGLSDTYVNFSNRLNSLGLDNPDLAVLEQLFELFLYKSADKAAGRAKWASKAGNFPQQRHKKAVGAYAPIQAEMDAFMDRVAAAKQYQLALLAAERTKALCDFAERFLQHYQEAKLQRGLLDFDDLILKARRLLSDKAVAAWVLFRLDGGIDHILVDEAQDTSPAQWDVVEKLAQEFTSGEGARPDVERTIFVVGDKKQSIYSFQGADPDAFDRMRDVFGHRLEEASLPFASLGLQYSFRSSHAVLKLVDATLTDRPLAGFPADMRHLAFKDEMPGRVDLWPVFDPVTNPDPAHWEDPVDVLSDQHHTVQLAHRVAGEIRRLIDRGEPLWTKNGPRPVSAGDFLVLVQKRSALFHEIIRACKDEGLPIAGADRLKVGGELAVKDIAALLSFLATPEDDLSLAVALRSPLFGLSEQALFTLAHGRGKRFLWQVLRERRDAHPDVLAVLDDLLVQADFLRPYDLIERLLTRHGGRIRLLGRLGAEAEDGIDALLAQALAYERSAVPSLTGFLVWLETDDLEIKRQMDSAGDRIRVMTVHGAKGLEAPIVILPDTADLRAPRTSSLLEANGGVIWAASADEAPAAQRAAAEAAADAARRERERLLYVAMTRAESWLIVAAAGETKSDTNWYRTIENGARTAGAAPHTFQFGEGLRLSRGVWPEKAKEAPREASSPVVLPHFFRDPAPDMGAQEGPLSPSDLGGVKALPGEDALDEETAKLRGSVLHRVLELVPAQDGDPRELANTIVDAERGALPDEICSDIVNEAETVLRTQELAHLFAKEALAEAQITGTLDVFPGRRVHGIIDRLLIAGDRVLAVDFKSHHVVPSDASRVPEGILRQMGAYDALLRQVYPGHNVETAILWTRNATLMPLPHDMVKDALSRAARLDAG